MRRLRLVYLVLALGAGVTMPAAGQFWPDSAWWHYSSNVFASHPGAHVLGGMALDLAVRGPWIAKPFRDRWWKRLAWVALFQTAWETFQVREIHGYPGRFARWDVEAALVGGGVAEVVIHHVLRR